MSARNGLRVIKVRRSKKAWAEVHTKPDGALVAFEDLFDMVQLIIACEVEKYEDEGRNPHEAWLRWGAMVQELLVLCTRYGADWDTVADRFGLPRRDGTRTNTVILLKSDRGNEHMAWPGSIGRNPDGTWGEIGWFTEALYREWG